ncbi:MAG: VOC family protein [Vicinamibacterales bacterium]
MAAVYGLAPPGYRLPDATRVGRVRLQVSHLDRSLDYYQGIIGLRLLGRAGVSAILGPQGEETPLVELHERPGARRVPPHGRFGLYHFALLVPERSELGRFVAHLLDADVRVASADHLVSEALYLWDPDGLGIEVYADRPRSEWRARGLELAMATESLDLRALLRAAHGGPWKGLPRGTVIGHIHLHVGSLARAEALYHVGLGFDKTVWSFPGALFLGAGGYHHHLGTNTWVEGASQATGEDARLLEWELLVPGPEDVRAAAQSLVAAGYDVASNGRDLVVSDDWGTRLRLMAR